MIYQVDSSQDTGGPVPGQLIVCFEEGFGQEAAEEVIGTFGCKLVNYFDSFDQGVVEVPVGEEDDFIKRIKLLKGVLSAEQFQTVSIMGQAVDGGPTTIDPSGNGI